MTDIDQLKGSPFDERANATKLPRGLNILTILTFIGCGIGLLATVYQQISAQKNLELMEKMQGSDELEKMPSFVQKMYSPEAVEIARLTYENRVPLMIITIVGLLLCVYGAIQMRQLKKQGFYMWLIGEILPMIGSAIFIGVNVLTGFIGITSIVITGLFVILYAMQLKHLR